MRLLKRVPPFALSLIVGIVLGSFSNSGSWHMGEQVRLRSEEKNQIHSKTWLSLRSLPVPYYSVMEAREKNIRSSVRLRAFLDTDATVSKVEQIEVGSAPLLTNDAINAAKRIQFTPATVDGKPIRLWVVIDYSCSEQFVAHHPLFGCDARIIEVEKDWHVVYE